MLNLYVVVLAVIVIALMAVSIAQIRKVKTKADYLIAGRSLPAHVLVFTLLCSWIGAGSLFAGAENAFRNGFAALWQPGGGWIGLIVILFVAPKARKFAQFTIPDLLEARYNSTARILGTIAILFAYTAITSYQFKGGGDVLHLAFGIDNTLGMYIIATFVIIFTALAGMASVAYMDVVIGLLITFTSFLSVPILLYRVGGWAGLQQTLPADRFQLLGHLTFARAMEFFLPTFLLMLGNQSMYQKFFSAKSERAARNAVWGWLVGTLILETLIVAIAVCGSALFGPHAANGGIAEVIQHPREIIPFVARHGLPPLVGALLLGAIFAKVISTANNYLFSPATNLVNDVYTRFINKRASNQTVLLVSRLMVVGLGLFALLQGAYWESILAMALYAYTIYSAAVTPVVMAAFFWKRATAAGAIACLALGTFVTIFWNYGKPFLPAAWAERDAIFPALLVSVVALVVTSLLTEAPAREKIAAFLPEEG